MKTSFSKIIQGYEDFRKKYADGDTSIMKSLSDHGQQPETMVISCCDSRVDPAVILQCEPGDLFVVRNVANIVPPYEKDEKHHGTSAALEFGICFLKIRHLIILGHSQCGGIQALLEQKNLQENDFITNWVSIIKPNDTNTQNHDEFSKEALKQSYKNCLTFPWIRYKVNTNELNIHLWFFDIKTGQIFTYCDEEKEYKPLT